MPIIVYNNNWNNRYFSRISMDREAETWSQYLTKFKAWNSTKLALDV